MKRLFILAALLAPIPALAQGAPKPVTLSPQEYQAVVDALVESNPILSLMLRKQTEAQRAAAAAAEAQKKP